MTPILSFLKNIPDRVWIALICLALGIAIGNYVRSVKEERRDNAAIAKQDTIVKEFIVYLPAQKDTSEIQGVDLPMTKSARFELDSLRRWNATITMKLDRYESMLNFRSRMFDVKYEDSVQYLTMRIDPVKRTGTPRIRYKPLTMSNIEILRTLPPVELPWYKTGTAKVVYGVVGAGLIYGAIESEGANRMYLSMAGITILAIGIAL